MTICRCTIKVYSDNTFSTEKGEYITMINPSNINITNDIEYNSSQLGYNTNWQLRYQSYVPRILSFSLLFDSTGILTQNNVDVKKQIEDLEGLIYSYKKDIKEPYYVRVIWGAIDFKGRLLKMQTNYSLFKSEGLPIRAQVNISIIEQQNKISEGNSQKDVEEEKEDTPETQEEPQNTVKENKVAENKGKNDDENPAEQNRDDAVQEKEKTQKENKEENNNEEKDDQESTDDVEQNNENEEGDVAEQNEEENNAEEEQNNEEEEKKEDSQEEETNEEVQQVTAQESDSLPSITKKCLANSGVKISSGALNSILSQAARFNLLNTLKSLAAGAMFALPLTLLGLLKALMKKLLSLLKRGVTFIKKKAKGGAKAVAGAARNVAGRTKAGYRNVRSRIR